ncbi:MAG: hypothetical protein ABII72_01160 [Parcubacteria group bacterium]
MVEGELPNRGAEEEIVPEKGQIIRDIRAGDAVQWREHVSDPEHQNKLNIPPAVLRSLVPEQLFELANDSWQVEVVPLVSGERATSFLVVEKDGEPERTEFSHEDRVVLDHFLTHDMRGIVEHVQAEGDLSTADRLVLLVEMKVLPLSYRKGIQVLNYRDRPSQRGKGVATGFYTELDRIKELGFAFVVGSNDNPEEAGGNYSFYKDKLGRGLVSDISRREREKLGIHNMEFDSATIKFFN